IDCQGTHRAPGRPLDEPDGRTGTGPRARRQGQRRPLRARHDMVPHGLQELPGGHHHPERGRGHPLARPQRTPGRVSVAPAPGDPCRRPDPARHPHPPDGGRPRPPAVVVDGPTERLIAGPGPAGLRPDPASVDIGLPVAAHPPWPPDGPVLGRLDPLAVPGKLGVVAEVVERRPAVGERVVRLPGVVPGLPRVVPGGPGVLLVTGVVPVAGILTVLATGAAVVVAPGFALVPIVVVIALV